MIRYKDNILRDIQISIISHGHGSHVEELLNDLSKLDSASRLQVTVVENIIETHKILYSEFSYPVKVVTNKKPMGFSENNNIAFINPVNQESVKYFFVINPDVRLVNDVFPAITSDLDKDRNIGVIATHTVSYNGSVQDSAREFPTPAGIIRKLLTGDKGITEHGTTSYCTDWVAGMFMAFRCAVYKEVNGFNQNYRMYYEDVDICCRITSIGYKIMVRPDLQVIHEGKRDSHRKIKYLFWHITSMVRYFLSECYKDVVVNKAKNK